MGNGVLLDGSHNIEMLQNHADYPLWILVSKPQQNVACAKQFMFQVVSGGHCQWVAGWLAAAESGGAFAFDFKRDFYTSSPRFKCTTQIFQFKWEFILKPGQLLEVWVTSSHIIIWGTKCNKNVEKADLNRVIETTTSMFQNHDRFMRTACKCKQGSPSSFLSALP